MILRRDLLKTVFAGLVSMATGVKIGSGVSALCQEFSQNADFVFLREYFRDQIDPLLAEGYQLRFCPHYPSGHCKLNGKMIWQVEQAFLTVVDKDCPAGASLFEAKLVVGSDHKWLVGSREVLNETIAAAELEKAGRK